MSDQLLYPVIQAAAVLGIGRSKLYSLLDAGELRAVRIGRRRLIARAELERFAGELEAQCQAS